MADISPVRRGFPDPIFSGSSGAGEIKSGSVSGILQRFGGPVMRRIRIGLGKGWDVRSDTFPGTKGPAVGVIFSKRVGKR